MSTQSAFVFDLLQPCKFIWWILRSVLWSRSYSLDNFMIILIIWELKFCKMRKGASLLLRKIKTCQTHLYTQHTPKRIHPCGHTAHAKCGRRGLHESQLPNTFDFLYLGAWVSQPKSRQRRKSNVGLGSMGQINHRETQAVQNPGHNCAQISSWACNFCNRAHVFGEI